MRFVFILLAAALLGGGCASFLTKPVNPEHLPVTMGAAPTNTTEAIAWLLLSQQANRSFNPTPTSGLVDVSIGALIAVMTAAGGWMARHNTPHTTVVTRSGDKLN